MFDDKHGIEVKRTISWGATDIKTGAPTTESLEINMRFGNASKLVDQIHDISRIFPYFVDYNKDNKVHTTIKSTPPNNDVMQKAADEIMVESELSSGGLSEQEAKELVRKVITESQGNYNG